MDRIAILLSTFNGEKYIKEQLDSLLFQTYNNFIVYIRDDGSEDNTIEILEEYKNKYSEKFKLINENKHLGIRQSFEKLMMLASNEKYFALCDQDDYWEPNKLEVFYYEMQLIETNNKDNFSILLISDMAIVDKYQKIIKASFLKYFNLTIKDINNGLFRGLISGCLMFFNQAVIKEYFRNNRYMLHDHNVFITTFLHGEIHLINVVLLKYRIHENNYYGLSKKNPLYISLLDLIKYFFNNTEYRKIVLYSYLKYTTTFIRNENKQLCNRKELYNEDEINNLSYFKRKKWYLNHFKPFGEDKIQGLIKLILI